MPHSLLLALAVSAAAPVPADTEKPKPRAALLGTLTLSADLGTPLWAPDGKHLIFAGGADTPAVRVFRRDQLGGESAATPAVEFKLPAGCTTAAFTPDGTELYAVSSTRGRFNAEQRAHFWNLKRVLDGKDAGKPDRTITLETDGYTGGVLAAGGKQFVLPVIEGRSNGQPRRGDGDYTVRFERASAKTGDRTGEWARFDDADLSYAGHGLDPRADRLFVLLNATDDSVVRAIDLTTGKQLWERRLPDKPYRGPNAAFAVAADGGLVAVTHMTLHAEPQRQPPGGFGRGGPGGGPPQMSYSTRQTATVLNAKTGEPVELATDGVMQFNPRGFSADGRLMIAQVTKDTGAQHTAVWDTKTGKVVKTWAGQHDVTFAFAPGGYDLLAVERDRKDVYGPSTAVPQGFSGNGGQMWTTTREVIRTEYKSTLGVWDLAPLVK